MPSLWSRVWAWLGAAGSAAPQPFRRPALRGRYDAAQTTYDNQKHWSQAENSSPTAENLPDVRFRLRNRARYECANNGYAEGMVSGRADDLVGTGPTLQILIDDDTVAEQIEKAFSSWAKATCLGEKLHTMDQARNRDGEAFAVLRTNPSVNHPVKLDVHPIEADRVAPPYGFLWPILPYPESSSETGQYFDGIYYDTFGNPVAYDVLRQHPGDLLKVYPPPADIVPARYILHWFKRKRPGQLRGVPEITSSLPLFAYLRRWTLASVSAAEIAATMGAAVLKSEAPANVDDSQHGWEPSPFSTVEFERGMMTELPAGMELQQINPSQPSTTYGEFKRELLAEAARPLSMPVNIALADSSKHNFSSAKLDHFGYRNAIKVDRAFSENHTVERIFLAFVEEARLIPGLLPAGVDAASLPRAWYWPGWASMDKDEAKNVTEELHNGTTTLAEECASEGVDWKERVRQMGREAKLREQEGVPLPSPGGAGGPPGAGDGGGASPPPAKPAAKPEQSTEAEANRNGHANGYHPRLRGFDPDQTRDDHGRFGEGSGDSAHEDARDKEDAARDEQHQREDDTIQQQRDKEDADRQQQRDHEEAMTDQARDKEDTATEARQEKEQEALEAGHEKEDAEVEKARDREDAATEKQAERNEAATEKARDKEDAATDKARDKEDDQMSARHDKEEAALVNQSEKEDWSEEKHDHEWNQMKERQDKEELALVDKRDKEDAARDEKRGAEDRQIGEKQQQAEKETQARRDKEDEDRATRQEKEKSNLEQKHEAEKTNIDKAREKQDQERQSQYDKEDRDHDGRRNEEDAAREAAREREDKRIQEARDKEDAMRSAASLAIRGYSEDQPRDERGRFGEGGGGGAPSAKEGGKGGSRFEKRQAQEKAKQAQEKVQKQRATQDRATEKTRQQEDTSRSEGRQAEDKARTESRNRQDEEVSSRHESARLDVHQQHAEDRITPAQRDRKLGAIDRRESKEKGAIARGRTREDKVREKNRSQEDKARERARTKEDKDTQKERGKEDKQLSKGVRAAYFFDLNGVH